MNLLTTRRHASDHPTEHLTRATPAARREGSVMSALHIHTTRRSGTRLLAAVAAVVAVGAASGVMVTHADPFRTRALETGASQDLAVTPPPTWPVVADTCAAGSPCDVTVTAGTGSVSVADAVQGDAVVPFYGFGVNAAPPSLAGAPGSIIKVPVGTTIHLTLDNQLPAGQALDLSFPSLTHVSHTGSVYTVLADRVGTMVFQAGTGGAAPRQVAMGLVGVLVVTPAVPASGSTPAADCATCAFDPAVAYDDEAVVAMTDLDPEFAADPLHFDMSYFGQPRDAQQRPRRVYHVINGHSFPDTDVIDVRAGDDLLVRYVNAGVTDKYMGLLGLRQSLLGRNASSYVDAQTLIAPIVGPGETADVAVSVPADTAAGQKFSLMDQSRAMNDGTAEGFGGALTFVDVWAGTPPAAVAPTVTGLAYDGTTLTATGAATAPATVTSFEVGVTDTNVEPATWTPGTGDPAAISMAVTAVPGQYVWVRVTDSNGTVSTAASLPIPFVAPTVTGVAYDGTTVTATGAATAPATVASFEVGVTDTNVEPATWTPGSGDPVAISMAVTAAHGQYVWVRVTDSNGTVSTAVNLRVPYDAPTVAGLGFDGTTLTATGAADPLLNLTGFEFAVTDTAVAPTTWTAGAGDPVNIAVPLTATTGQYLWLRVTDSQGAVSADTSMVAP